MDTIKVYYMKTAAVKGREEYLYSVLPKSRALKAQRYIKEGDRLLSLAAGCLIYRVIGDFFIDEYGKPRSQNAFFGVSHSGEIAVLAVGNGREIGIDIECLQKGKDYDELAKYVFGDAELEIYRRGESFPALFTAKESLAKAEGRGIGKDVKAIPALPLNGEVGYKNKNYYRHSLEIEGYYGSVTREKEDFTIETEEVYDV